uniref:Cation channel sperm-associated protein subunit gamma n=1 Tax=Naja naja TaxID=35670 RepID=A0A8C6VLQ8_NAJNA
MLGLGLGLGHPRIRHRTWLFLLFLISHLQTWGLLTLHLRSDRGPRLRLCLPLSDSTQSLNILGFTLRWNRMFWVDGHVLNISFISLSGWVQLYKWKSVFSLSDPSRPLWATYRKAPVVILGGIPEKKIVIVSETNFDTYHLIEVGIDSCWIGSLSCPQRNFSSSIVDAIATESTLFIRQNQLVYYFTGHYPILHQATKGSDLWTRILNKVCVKRLLPVFFPHNNTEYVIALSGGFQEGEFFLISCKGRGNQKSRDSQSVIVVPKMLFSGEENKFHLLVTHRFNRKSYITKPHSLLALMMLLLFFSTASDKGFVMLLGTEAYSNTTLVARGLAYNPFSHSFYIWGNVILLSQDMMNYIYLSNFPHDSPIKDFVLSFTGPFAIMTDREETRRVLDPSSPSSLPVAGLPCSRIPVRKACKMGDNVFSVPSGKDYIQFTHLCPFATMRMVNLPRPQRYTREEYYWATPPDIMDKSGFHHKDSLTVYQGLVYQLLQLHSSYHRVRTSSPSRLYSDPVHDPTWRWWKNQKEEAEYFSYKASNWKSLGGIYVDMANYAKIYNVMPDNDLPQYIYLDKNTAYSFNVFLTIRSETTEENSLNNIWLTVILTHPEYVEAKLQRQELISRGSVLIYRFTALSKQFTETLAHFLVGPQGIDALEIHIGCPPGKRLAFDITYTKNYTTEKNKRYFDCVVPDPEMPCFYFSDVFFPFFLIQDMVTGDSGRFHDSKPRDMKQLILGSHLGQNLFFPFRWICQKDSPCYDIVPQSMATPDYFFVIKVSNRGVDQTTYCDYALEFIVHIHGLRLSPTRALYCFFSLSKFPATSGYLVTPLLLPLTRCVYLVPKRQYFILAAKSQLSEIPPPPSHPSAPLWPL